MKEISDNRIKILSYLCMMKMKNILTPWTVLSIVLAIVSVLVLQTRTPISKFSFPIFAIGVLFSICIWNFVGKLIGLLPNVLRFFFLVLISFVVVFVSLTAINVYKEFQFFIDPNLIGLVLKDPMYFKDVSDVFFQNNLNVALTLLMVGVISFLMIKFSSKEKRRRGLKEYLLLIVLGVIITIGQNRFGSYGIERFHSIDMTLLFVSKYYVENKELLTSRNNYSISTNRNKPNQGSEKFYNIVFVIQESMSVEPLSIYGYKNDYMPFFKGWHDSEDGNFILFKDAMAISGCTDMSVPTLLTGVGPEEMTDKIMQMPFLWDYAKANGYGTAMMSSQRYSWANFRTFIKNKSLDKLYSAEDSGLNNVNDLGVDDIAVSVKVKNIY